AEALADLGVNVAILDIHRENAVLREKIIVENGGSARAFQCDVLDEANLKDCLAEISEQWEAPDILINGAGGNHPKGSTGKAFMEFEDIGNPDIRSLFDLELEGFRRVFDLNFMGTFLPTKIFARGMMSKPKHAGTVLNISSMSALTPLTKVAAYSAAKAAVSNFTRWLAVHLAHVGIRVNAISPGFLMTEHPKFLHIDQEPRDLTPRARPAMAHTPLGR
ncbi:MAG: SDR family NAD(P)-dependent oxidoreductase, partial [Rhodobacteraceae bacterium]|nr:SDR family NAD(P)-dependent oxidoreductase [Paracoccaceae bacterium]